MRNDKKHFIGQPRICHKAYKILSHFEFNIKDKHGCSIPHNCKAGNIINIKLQHFGHMTKELRDEKRKKYENTKDKKED